MDLAVFTVEQNSPLAGKTLLESQVRKEHCLTVVAVNRDTQTHMNPDGNFKLEEGDKVYVFGMQEDVVEKSWLFSHA